LRKVKHILAVGGIFSWSDKDTRELIMKEALKNPGISLLPEQADIIFDSEYLLYAIGVLAEHYPDKTFDFARELFVSNTI